MTSPGNRQDHLAAVVVAIILIVPFIRRDFDRLSVLVLFVLVETE
jgi:hypothetical protein